MNVVEVGEASFRKNDACRRFLDITAIVLNKSFNYTSSRNVRENVSETPNKRLSSSEGETQEREREGRILAYDSPLMNKIRRTHSHTQIDDVMRIETD